ncbi:hypothetical protein EPUL_003073 [Erysiphe pulchra]|uniref:EKA-like protein n=1 Tax=Erysiphe pulchra TaxID=225359 RepID=A0A2S4PQR3_9PEZI|nr:hypothetical protein EPUL_003073 [Erysiphe pulchra]
MPPKRTKRQLTKAEIAKSRARARLKNKGLAPDLIDIDAVETAISALKPTEQINLPLTTSLPVFQAQLCTSSSGKELVVACPNTPSPSVSHDTPSIIESNKNIQCPPELQALVEAGQRRVAQTAANIEICTAAINSVEAVLAPLSNGTRNKFVASLKDNLRSAIAQFQRSAVPIMRKSTRNTKANFKNTAQNPTRSTWATIANKAHQKSPATPNMSQSLTSKMTGKSITESSSLSGADERLFLRIAKDHEWRLLSP